LLASYSVTINGQSYTSTVSISGSEYTASVPGVGSVTGYSEAAVEAAISLRISEMV